MMLISSICSASGRRRATCSASNLLADNPFNGEQSPLRLRLSCHKIRKSPHRVEKCTLRSALHQTVRIGLSAVWLIVQRVRKISVEGKLRKQLFYASIFTKIGKEEFNSWTRVSDSLLHLYDPDHLMNQMRTLMEIGPLRHSSLYGLSNGWYRWHTIPLMLPLYYIC